MKNYLAVFVLLLLLPGMVLFAQQAPKAFKYQAVARDADNQPYANTNLRLRIGVVNAANVIAYLETHNVTTSDLGVFSLNVGQGTLLSGNFNNVNWGAEPHFLSIELSTNNGVSYTSMGTSPLLSVPYALYAGQAAQMDGGFPDDSPTNELQTLSISGTVLTLSNGGGSVTLPVGGGGGDNWGTQTVQTSNLLSGNGTPANPLSIADNAINSAKIQNGSIQAVDIAPGVIPNYTAGTGISIAGNQIINTGDGDSSPANELQTLSLSGNNLSLSNGGGTVALPPNTDAQTLALSGNQLSISNGNSVTLPTGTTYTAGSGININGNVISAADNSPVNEIQTLALSGTVLSLSNGGGSVTLPGGGGGGDNWGTQIVETTILLSGNGTPFNPLSIADNAINSAKIQNGSIQAVDIAPGVIPNYTAGTGISISGSQITNTGDGDNNSTNELQSISLSGNNLSLSNGGGTVALPPNTDAQTLSLVSNQLSISNGNSVTLPAAPSYTAGTGISINGNQITNTGDGDSNPANELQTLSLSGNNLSLSNGGGSVALPPNTDAQTLSLISNQLSISNGNSVTLPTGTTYTAGSGINITGNAISATDNSATNELQTISLSGNNLSLSNGGGSVTLPSGGTSYWQSAGGNDIINSNSGTVFVGGSVPFQAIFASANNNSQTIVVQQNGTGQALSVAATNSSGAAVEIVGGFTGLNVSGNATGISGINVGPIGGFGVYGESLVPFGTGGAFRNENGTGLEVVGAFRMCYLSGGGGSYYCPSIYGATGSVNTIQVGANWWPDAINSGIRNLGSSSARWNTIFAVNGVINTSDARQKQAIQPLGYGLQQVMAMKPVSFEWSSHPERGRKIGFLAQELQSILPEVVADKEWTADENGVMQAKEAAALGVYYSDIIPVLAKAIQEQQEQIAAQAAEIQALKAALEAQRQDVARILAKLDAGQK